MLFQDAATSYCISYPTNASFEDAFEVDVTEEMEGCYKASLFYRSPFKAELHDTGYFEHGKTAHNALRLLLNEVSEGLQDRSSAAMLIEPSSDQRSGRRYTEKRDMPGYI